MKKHILTLLLSFFTVYTAFTQNSFEKLFSKQSTDVFRSVQEVTSGGGYIAAGYTADSSANDTDAYVVRFNTTGDTIWTYTYNGPLSKKDLFYKIIKTSDGGFITCGYTNSETGTSDDILYVKLNSSGKKLWSKTFGGSGKEHGQDIIETSNGFTIAGYSTTPPAQYFDALVIHTSLNGNVLWSKVIGDSNYDDANAIKKLTDGGYILGGQSTNGNKGLDQYLIRLNSSGDTLWTKRFGTLGNDNIESLVLLSDGYVVAGNTSTPLTGDDGYLVKTDLNGTLIWSKTFGGSDQDDIHRVEKTTDGGFILSGTTSSYGPLNPNMWLVKTNSSGDSTWARTFGGDNHDHGYSAIQTSDGGYIIAGHTGSFGFNNEDGYVVKIGSDGMGSNKLTYITAYSLNSPSCSGASTQVAVTIRNFGNEAVSNIPVTVEITGSITQTLFATFAGPLAAQDLTTISFTPLINTISGGTYTFKCFTGISNDVYPPRNSFTKAVTLSACTGIEDLQTQLGFSIYPNPSNGIFVIDFNESYSKTKIELINITGAVVQRFSINNTNDLRKSIDLSALSKGLYLLRVSTNEGFDVRRIVLE